MTRALILTQLDTGKKFVLGGPTQVGRVGRERRDSWEVPERPKPDFFDSLDAVITLAGNNWVSRNHAGIYPDEGTYYIRDLHSLNKTFVNGEKLSEAPRALIPGDRIQFSMRCPEFEVCYGELNNHALLIAAGEDNPGAMKNGLDTLERHLRRRGYICHTLMGRQATKDAVKNKLNDLKYLIPHQAQLFVSFHGHGGPHGLSLGDKIMNPRELYDKLRPIRGSKAIVLDACNAGLFVNDEHKHRIPDNTLVLSSCGPGQKASEGTSGNQEFSPRFTDALAHYLDEHPGVFSLKDFFDELEQSQFNDMVLQGPMMKGHEYPMPKEVTELLTGAIRLDQTSPGFTIANLFAPKVDK
jgi:hypothetical protein